MKLSWEDVYDIFDDAALWENGHDMYWYKLMWGLMEYRGMNEYNNESDKVKVISRAFAIIKIYTDFIVKCFDDDEFEEAISLYNDDVFDCLYDDSDVHEIFSALHKELGTRRTFYSMFITCVEFRNGQISYADDDTSESETFDSLSDYHIYDDADCEEESEDSYEFDLDDFDEDFEEQDSEKYEEEIPEDCSEDYYYSFESYLQVLATSSMSLLDDFTGEKAAGFIYLAKNMKND